MLLAVPKIALGLFLVLAAIGVFLGIATKHIAEIAAPFEVVARIVEWVGIAVSVAWGPVAAGPAVDRPGRAVVDRPESRQRQHDRLAGPAQG